MYVLSGDIPYISEREDDHSIAWSLTPWPYMLTSFSAASQRDVTGTSIAIENGTKP